jgi:hypothetical protein
MAFYLYYTIFSIKGEKVVRKCECVKMLSLLRIQRTYDPFYICPLKAFPNKE